jgi:phosphocarrier protein
MLTKNITIQNSVGLHARPATYFISKSQLLQRVPLDREQRQTRKCKSLLGVLSLGISKGDVITILADGVDEQEAVDGLVDLILKGFNE